MSKTEFNMLYLYPAKMLREFDPDGISIRQFASGTVTIKLNTMHSAHLLLCSGKLGKLSDFSGFASLLTPTVKIIGGPGGVWQGPSMERQHPGGPGDRVIRSECLTWR